MESLAGKTSEEVEVPKLAENRQNWKIYRTKVIEAAATDITNPLGVLAGWQPDDGSYNWECLDAMLKWTFYTSVPITILCPIRKLDTAHKIFNYLVKSTAVETQENYPTSANAATKWHANAKLDKEDLLTTQDVNNGNVGRTEDPRTSAEALVKGIGAEHSEMTPFILTSVSHEMQNQPHSSLPLTLRLPVDGEPCECKQEVVESIMMAECTNGMVNTAEPTETIEDINLKKAALGRDLVERACRVNEGDKSDVDVNEKAVLGEELVERAHIVNKGDKMEHRCESQLQIELYCKETNQCNANTNKDIPFANGLPLEGEWTVNPSGERDMSMHVSVDGTGSNTGQKVEPADTPNELEQLMTMSIEPDDADGGGRPIICLRDGSNGQTDGLGVLTDAPSASNRPEMVVVSHRDSAGMYLGAGGVKGNIDMMDGVESHAHTSAGHREAPSVETHAMIPANKMESVTYLLMERVSVNVSDMYLLWNAPIEAPGRKLVFGEVEGGVKAVAPIVEGETPEGAGNGDGNQYRDNDDSDSTTSGSGIHSKRVEAVLLAAKSQHQLSVLQIVHTDLLDAAVDAEESNPYLQRSAKHRKLKRLTQSTSDLCSHSKMARNVCMGPLDPAIDPSTSRLNL
ncbi:hypothetical protein SCLCIDRAFT_34417 [Scleroderma citrinum Foug A]|uniref:Uncharacterized protein n=1 Tax=Scleroderma citrinum Foug A TaxID=1036808 RepID=A0A0C2YKL9_9AGAM|nr:hypothetical protein SCLCIDRAFT_34418 [Scleroderma citrinum Foug A]KIM50319.1 hypothetical protein SCLCIDRAFT_34417 [Scleroderma citrinum Foug A]